MDSFNGFQDISPPSHQSTSFANKKSVKSKILLINPDHPTDSSNKIKTVLKDDHSRKSKISPTRTKPVIAYICIIF